MLKAIESEFEWEVLKVTYKQTNKEKIDANWTISKNRAQINKQTTKNEICVCTTYYNYTLYV